MTLQVDVKADGTASTVRVLERSRQRLRPRGTPLRDEQALRRRRSITTASAIAGHHQGVPGSLLALTRRTAVVRERAMPGPSWPSIAASLRAYLEWQRTRDGGVSAARETATGAAAPTPEHAGGSRTGGSIASRGARAGQGAPPPAARHRGLRVARSAASPPRARRPCSPAATPTRGSASSARPPARTRTSRGCPFVGRAGQLLDRMIGAMGLDPEPRRLRLQHPQVPPPGQPPARARGDGACFPYLHEQLALVTPRVIVALGQHGRRPRCSTPSSGSPSCAASGSSTAASS